MNIYDILPIIIPGIPIQLFVQAYFIHHCWNNDRLKMKTKVRYIIGIVLFNIAAAAIYLFFSREKPEAKTIRTGATGEDVQVRQGIFVSLLVAFEIFSLRFILDNSAGQTPSWLVWLIGLCFVCLILDGLFEWRALPFVPHLLIVIQIAAVSVGAYYDYGQNGQFLVLLVVAGIINRHAQKTALYYVAAAFALFMTATILQGLDRFGTINSEEVISGLYVRLLLFVLVFALFYSLKKQLLANRQLMVAIYTMQEQAAQLEQMSALAERSRIVGEIHDTVGHTLTTAVIALEAGTQLINEDQEAAREKINLARDQVKKGLQDLRSSIRTIQTGGNQPFRPALDQLLAELDRTTDLNLSAIIEIKTELLPIQQYVLLQAIRELATNSLKHGRSRSLDLLLQEYKGAVHLTVSDDGDGSDNPEMGFGLNHMQDQVFSIGGTMQIDSKAGEGFTVHIAIPAGQKTEADQTGADQS
ncbi:MAG: sensor histidine kinase [Bacillota bacterium]|nr:sensor histidine kinase [Bacillota bacterium]